jgi:hypothetical protein
MNNNTSLIVAQAAYNINTFNTRTKTCDLQPWQCNTEPLLQIYKCTSSLEAPFLGTGGRPGFVRDRDGAAGPLANNRPYFNRRQSWRASQQSSWKHVRRRISNCCHLGLEGF